MAILTVQNSDTNATVSSGVAWNLPNNVGVGATVIMAVRNHTSIPPTSVSGLGGTWVNVNSQQRGNFASNVSWWYVIAASATKAITVTGSTYEAVAWELTGASTPVTGGTHTVTTNNPTGALTVTGLVAGELVLVGMLTAAASTTNPTSPWSIYNAGSWTEATADQDVAYQVTSGSSDQTATWTTAAAQNWGLAGLIVPAAATPTYGGTLMPVIAGA